VGQLVPKDAGVRSCLRELGAAKGDVEVVLGGGPWLDYPEVATGEPTTEAPLLRTSTIGAYGGGIETTRHFDVAQDLYLGDHRLDGKAVVPAAMAAELMAEVAQAGWADWTVTGLAGFRVLHGIVLDDAPITVRTTARVQTHAPSDTLAMHVDVEIGETGREKPSYRATALLAPEIPAAEAPAPLDERTLGSFPLADDQLYRQWLFHGPRFQCIDRIDGFGPAGLIGRLRPSTPAQALAGASGDWLLDPVLLDGGLQLALLWMRATHDVSALPAGFAAVRRWAPIGSEPITCHLKAHAGGTAHATRFDVRFIRADGRLALSIEELEATGSRALNRLMGWPQPHAAVSE
jgi:hypothetical protein